MRQPLQVVNAERFLPKTRLDATYADGSRRTVEPVGGTAECTVAAWGSWMPPYSFKGLWVELCWGVMLPVVVEYKCGSVWEY